jgi:hypothetical protein
VNCKISVNCGLSRRKSGSVNFAAAVSAMMYQGGDVRSDGDIDISIIKIET